jgi:hypothetical protein
VITKSDEYRDPDERYGVVRRAFEQGEKREVEREMLAGGS